MRYRIGSGPDSGAYGGSADFVTFTVVLTLVIGIGFLVAGIKGGQRWLAIWGGLTITACATYGVAIMNGWLA